METFTLKHRGISIFQFSRPACRRNEEGSNERTEGRHLKFIGAAIKRHTGALQQGGQTKRLPKGPELEATTTLKPLKLFKDHVQDNAMTCLGSIPFLIFTPTPWPLALSRKG